ncbi:MAG: hypothetical protein RJA70_1045 [Pseudomonadota bacterium]|jgi:pSer/pThr/pTyr-binding forkhead associated (FHA) protein
MAITLSVRSGDVNVPAITLDSPRIVIGRGAGCELQLPDPSVSHRHTSIRQRGSEYIVLDEGSTNGTFVGPVRLPPGAPRVVKDGDLLRIGRIWLLVKLEHGALPSSSPELTREIALGLVAGALQLEGQRSSPCVSVAEGPDMGTELVLAEFNKAYCVGRQTKCDLQLSDDDVSRRHISIERRGARILVSDLGSKNGARIGDRELAPSAQLAWIPGQKLTVGKSVLSLEDPLANTLLEIDAAPDERIDDSVEPPRTSEPPPEGTGQAPLLPDSRRTKVAPVAQAPLRPSPRPPKQRSWGSADVLIAVLALLVLGLSAAGMAWLFGE